MKRIPLFQCGIGFDVAFKKVRGKITAQSGHTIIVKLSSTKGIEPKLYVQTMKCGFGHGFQFISIHLIMAFHSCPSMASWLFIHDLPLYNGFLSMNHRYLAIDMEWSSKWRTYESCMNHEWKAIACEHGVTETKNNIPKIKRTR